jgi:hypothetical protein
LNILDEEELEKVYNETKELGITNEITDALRIILYETPRREFVEMQYKAALALGLINTLSNFFILDDQKLIIKRAIDNRTNILSASNADEYFAIKKFTMLKSPEEWAQKSLLGNVFGYEQRKEGFLKWTK